MSEEGYTRDLKPLEFRRMIKKGDIVHVQFGLHGRVTKCMSNGIYIKHVYDDHVAFVRHMDVKSGRYYGSHKGSRPFYAIEINLWRVLGTSKGK